MFRKEIRRAPYGLRTEKVHATFISLGLILKMKKQTKIIKDQRQTRTTIPAKFVKEAGVETGHIAEWELKNGKLKAEVKKDEKS